MTQQNPDATDDPAGRGPASSGAGRSPGGAAATRPVKLRPVSAEWLMRAASYYLERYASSGDNLRRVLRRKVMRRARACGEDPAQHEPLIEATLARLAELGLLDDRAFAAARLSNLRRKGTSRTMAAAKLKEKGVPREIVDATLEADETGEAAAAAAYARRRRFGPYRSSGRPDRRDKEIAAMVRAGFAVRLAIAAVDGAIDNEDGAASGPD